MTHLFDFEFGLTFEAEDEADAWSKVQPILAKMNELDWKADAFANLVAEDEDYEGLPSDRVRKEEMYKNIVEATHQPVTVKLRAADNGGHYVHTDGQHYAHLCQKCVKDIDEVRQSYGGYA